MAEPIAPVADSPAVSDWRGEISEQNRSGIAKFDSLDKLAGGYIELERAYGGTVKLPTEKSTPEEVSSFFTRCGRPDTSDGYNRPSLPEGKNYDEDLIGGMQTAAFEEGITDKQFGKMVERYLAIEAKKAETKDVETARVQEETTRALKELWHVEYDKNIEIARRAMRELVTGDLSESFKALIKDSGLGDNAVFIQGFQEIGSKILSDTLITPDGAPLKLEDDYMPSHPHSPEQYAHGEDEESKKARAWFTKRGHIY